MWPILISSLIIIIVYFSRDVFKLKNNIKSAGGMRRKYAVLSKLLLDGDARAKIYDETNTALTLGVQGLGAYTKFELIQGFDVIMINMTIGSNVFGEHKLNWKFNDNMNQEKIYELICLDIAKLNEKLP